VSIWVRPLPALVRKVIKQHGLHTSSSTPGLGCVIAMQVPKPAAFPLRLGVLGGEQLPGAVGLQLSTRLPSHNNRRYNRTVTAQ